MRNKRTESKLKIAARIAKAANTRRARTLAAKLAREKRTFAPTQFHAGLEGNAEALMDDQQRQLDKKVRHAFAYRQGTRTFNMLNPDEPALREQLLKDSIALTMGDRNKSYGDPFINFMLTARLKELFWDAMEASGKSVQQCSPYGHSIDMIITNLARIATSPTTHLERDRFLDGANYFAIAYEVGVRSEK